MPTISDYASLKQALLDFAHRNSLSTPADYFIQDGEDRIYRKILELNEGKGLRWMEAQYPSAAISNGTVPVPTDYLAPKDFQVIGPGGGVYPLQFRDVQWIYAQYPNRTADACPSFIARDSASSSPALTPLKFTATNGQTAFDLSSAPTGSSVVYVSLDGAMLAPSDYSIAGTTLTLTTGALTGQTLIVQYLLPGAFTLSGSPLSFTAGTSQTTFDLSAAPANSEILYVTLDGTTLSPPSDYSVSGTTLTLTTGANSGQKLVLQYVKNVTSSSSGSFIFGPYPDSNYTIQGTYYQRATALSSTNTTTWMTAQIPLTLHAACMASVCKFLKDFQGMQAWMAEVADRLSSVVDGDKAEQYASGDLQVASANPLPSGW